jgi:hypothetical protein
MMAPRKKGQEGKAQGRGTMEANAFGMPECVAKVSLTSCIEVMIRWEHEELVGNNQPRSKL